MEPPRLTSSRLDHSPVSSDRQKKNASSLDVIVHVTAKCKPLGWKEMCRTSPGSLNDATGLLGSARSACLLRPGWTDWICPKSLRLVRLERLCSPTLRCSARPERRPEMLCGLVHSGGPVEVTNLCGRYEDLNPSLWVGSSSRSLLPKQPVSESSTSSDTTSLPAV